MKFSPTHYTAGRFGAEVCPGPAARRAGPGLGAAGGDDTPAQDQLSSGHAQPYGFPKELAISESGSKALRGTLHPL